MKIGSEDHKELFCRSFLEMVDDPVLHEAIALQGREESRHGTKING